MSYTCIVRVLISQKYDSEVSVCDPYEGTDSDNDKDYVAGISSESSNSSESAAQDANLKQHKGKKKLQRKSLWKRNISKRRRTEGNSYLSSSGKTVQKKTIGESCTCKMKCFQRVIPELRKKIFDEFYKLECKDLQDSYLHGLIRAKSIQRRRPRHESRKNKPKQAMFQYQVRDGVNQYTVCKKAFAAIHGITKSRIERLGNQSNLQNCTAPSDRRGKHNNRANKLPLQVNQQICEHINSFPKYVSHYSRADNAKHSYLSSNLTISKMYEFYIQKYEPEQFLVVHERAKFKPTVKYDYYRKYFVENFKLSFGRPKSDTCSKCDKLITKLQAAESEQEKKRITAEKDLHVKKADTCYADLRKKSALAKEQKNVEVLCVDFEQNLPLPVAPNVFYKIQLWVFNFCIHMGSNDKSYFYVYDETLGGKGQNEVISCLNHFIRNVIPTEVTELYLFSDNCSSQNKNLVMVQFLYALVKEKRFKVITHRFPEPGHSFLPCDRSFGKIEIRKRKYDKIYLPEEYAKIIRESGKKFHVTRVSQKMFLNFKQHFAQYFVQNPSTKKNKFTISKYRSFVYDCSKTPAILCSVSVSLMIYNEFVIQKTKNDSPVTFPTNEELLYESKRKLKDTKYQHVMYLAKKFVPASDFWFYNDIETNQTKETTNNDECGSDVEVFDEVA